MPRLIPLAAVAFVFLIYWAGGGKFERGCALAFTVILAAFGGVFTLVIFYDKPWETNDRHIGNNLEG